MTTPTGPGQGGYGGPGPSDGGSGDPRPGEPGTDERRPERDGAGHGAGPGAGGVPVSGAPQVGAVGATGGPLGAPPPTPSPTPAMPPADGPAPGRHAAPASPPPGPTPAAPPRRDEYGGPPGGATGPMTAAAAGTTSPRTSAGGPGATGAPGGVPSGSTTMGSLPGGATPLRTGKPRRARLVVRRIDPWSVLKFTLLFSLCLLIVFVVAVAALYFALDAMGVFTEVNDFVRELTQASSGGQRTGGVEVPFTATRVIGVAAVIGLVNVVIVTAISTLGAFLYNLCADIVGGIELTLAERE